MEKLMDLPLTAAQKACLSDQELIRIAIDSFLHIKREPGNEDLESGAMATLIDEETGVGLNAASLVALTAPKK